MGPAVVIDCRSLRGQAAPGESPLITTHYLEMWEQEHGRIQVDDVVLLHTGWTDDTYRRFPEGQAFGHDVVIAKSGVSRFDLIALGAGKMYDVANTRAKNCTSEASC